MKKLLLLLFSTLAFGQDMYLDHSFTNSQPIKIGDTLSIKFNTIDNNQSSYTLLQFDYQYNNKLLQKLDHAFTTNAQASLNHWDGFSFNPNNNISLSDLNGQFNWWAGEASQNGQSSYSGSADWSVERITLQSGSAIPHDETFLTVRFIIKDKANTVYEDYSSVSKLSWARTNSPTVFALTQNIDLEAVKGGGAGDVVLILNTQAEEKTDYVYSITDEESNVVDSGNFDANGEAIITVLENDTQYDLTVYVDSNSATWLNDVVSLSDAYLLFLQAINAGDTPDQNVNQVDEIKKVVYDVNADGIIDFEDSYALLKHVIGEPLENTYITKDMWAYNISTTDKPLLPTEEDKVFNVYHYLAGDADFSHSHYTEQVSTSKFSLAKKNVINHDLDLVTRLNNGKVELTVNLDRSDLSTLEFIASFDSDKLEFDKIIFNSGDNITNYSTIKNNEIYFGSIDLSAKLQIKTGESYKIVFNPKVQLTNTAGLVYFRRQEGVTTQGQKISINLK